MSTVWSWIGSRSSLLRFVFVFMLVIGLADGAKVTAEALEAWNGQVQDVEAALAKGAAGRDRFMWIDQAAGRKGAVRAGGIITAPGAGGGLVPVSSSLIHHWVGAVFIPDVRLLDAIGALQDYDSYSGVFHPAVIDSKLLRHEPDQFTYRLKFQEKGFGVKAGMLGEFRSHYFRVDGMTGYSITQTTRVVELDRVGTASEHALTPDEAHGFIERMFTVVRYRECEDGVYVETETLTLSRDVPAGLRWLVNPAIQRFSKGVITGTLDKLRSRVEETRGVESASRGF